VGVCLTVTLLDGLVLARAAFSHSMNYRSVVVLGRAVDVTDPDEKMAAFEALVEHVCRGRWADVRQPNSKELRTTKVLRLDLSEMSTKVRTGGPKDQEADLALSVWAGVIPLGIRPEAALAEAPRDLPIPAYVAGYSRLGW
jgi:nitroimidazol reductase NimA-like FMN-containing flavoprotein (pyridoxamine 5'-phosphate oxidase superfamily)